MWPWPLPTSAPPKPLPQPLQLPGWALTKGFWTELLSWGWGREDYRTPWTCVRCWKFYSRPHVPIFLTQTNHLFSFCLIRAVVWSVSGHRGLLFSKGIVQRLSDTCIATWVPQECWPLCVVPSPPCNILSGDLRKHSEPYWQVLSTQLIFFQTILCGS